MKRSAENERPSARLASPTGDRAWLLEPVADFAPTATELAEYAGTYHSDEAEATYTVVVEGGALVIKNRYGQASSMTPSYPNAFTGSRLGALNLPPRERPRHRAERGRGPGLGSTVRTGVLTGGASETFDMHRVIRPAVRVLIAVVCVTALAVSVGFAQEPANADRFWPQWRGPLGTGVAPHGTPPVEWSESTNVRWKVAIPGRGSSTPVIWGDRLFVLTAVPTGDEARSQGGLFTRLRRRILSGVAATHAQRFMVLAIDRRDGRVIW